MQISEYHGSKRSQRKALQLSFGVELEAYTTEYCDCVCGCDCSHDAPCHCACPCAAGCCVTEIVHTCVCESAEDEPCPHLDEGHFTCNCPCDCKRNCPCCDKRSCTHGCAHESECDCGCEGDDDHGCPNAQDDCCTCLAVKGLARAAFGVGNLRGIEADSSIESDEYLAIELVSQPVTLAEWRKLDVSTKRHTGYVDVNDSCGMHVHASRGFLSNADWLDVADWLAQWTDGTIKDWFWRAPNEFCCNEASESKRYSAINLTNESTVEFRGFAGTTQTAKIQFAVELVHALIVAKTDGTLWAKTLNDIAADVAQVRPDLFDFIVKRAEKRGL